MLIKNLIKKLKSNCLDNSLSSIDIKGIACDSRKVLPGYLYVAIVGHKQDGHDFINQALKNGASALAVNENYKNLKDIKVPIIVVSDTNKALVDLVNEFYNYPSKKLKIIGITGTNGKTTITYLLEKILETAGFKVGVIGTVNYRFAGKIINATNTTPGPLELQELLASMIKQNLDYVFMEVSSHALDQNRVAGIKFRSAIFTNLTQDHLDYHKNLEDYFNAKAKLFKNLDKDATAIVNIDDIYSEKLIKKIKSRLISYSINKPSNIQAEEIKFSLEKSEFLVKIDKNKDLPISTKLIGVHNVYNILASIACALNEGIGSEDIKEAIKKLDFIPGRLQKVDFGQEVSIFVDYAHTPDALRNVLGTMKKIFNKKILVVFGAGGERDKDKRPKMGKIVSNFSDYIILTSDNPRSEDPLVICRQIASGIEGKNYEIVIDRKEAIGKALSIVDKDWIVLVAGKGHETYQVFKDKIIPFDDCKEIKECLVSKRYSKQRVAV